MWRSVLIIILSAVCLSAQPFFDLYDDNGPLMKSLATHVAKEHGWIKQSLDNDTETFNWTPFNLPAFPMLSDQCKMSFEYDRLRSLNGKGSVAYIESDGIVYVGTKYWYSSNGNLPDTTCYRIAAYKFRRIKQGPYIWRRVYDVITIVCRFNSAVSVSGRFYY